MAESLENVQVGHYRSLDPLKNLAVKVTLRRVTAAGFIPGFNIGSQQNVNVEDGAELAGDVVQMQSRPLYSNTAADSETEEYTFNWQQKVFSQREYDLYGDKINCLDALERKYHTDIVKLRGKGGRQTSRLFTYVDSDKFVNVDEETRTLTTSVTEQPTFLVEKMVNVRRRHNIGLRRTAPGGLNPRVNPVTIHQSESAMTSAHVINTPYRTMHIMADLVPEGIFEILCIETTSTRTSIFREKSDLEDEYVLCSIKIDANGQIFIKPDFNEGQQPYRIETSGENRVVYEYTLAHSSQAMSRDQKEQEAQSFSELYNRHAMFLASQVGTDFMPLPEPGVLRMMIFGEIVSAKGFEYDGLYVHFFLELPSKWSPENSYIMSGVTQTCVTKCMGKDDVAYFSFPFEFSMVYRSSDDEADGFIRWPILFLEVLSIDSWERYRTEGYGYVTIPNKPGSHTIVVDTWRPLGNGVIPELNRFFVGGSPELEDPTYPEQPAGADDKVLSKYYFRTVTSGSVTVRLNVVQQCQAFMESKKTTRRTRTLLDRLGGLSALDSLGQVMDAFQRARKRMLAAREGLPVVR